MPLGAGGYMPKSNVDRWLKGSEEINKWFKEATKEGKVRRANIVYELGNHEAFYTHDLDSTMDALGEGYSPEEVLKIFREELRAHPEEYNYN